MLKPCHTYMLGDIRRKLGLSIHKYMEAGELPALIWNGIYIPGERVLKDQITIPTVTVLCEPEDSPVSVLRFELRTVL